MKNIIKKIILIKLRFLTSIYLQKNKIEVVAITGSAGKTTAKMAIAQLVSSAGTYVPEEAYNTETGLPLAVFKEKVPTRVTSLFGWLGIIFSMTKKIFRKAPYQRIVLEMGADKPGDIRYFRSFVHPSVAVVTSVLLSHAENFKSLDAIRQEKSELVKGLEEKDRVVLNYDDENVRLMAKETKARVFWVGSAEKCDLKWEKVRITEDGMSFSFRYEGSSYPVSVRVFAPHLLPSLAAGFAVGIILGEKLPDLAERLSQFKPQKGRMSLLPGIRNSRIIDDTYNANPESYLAAIDVLSRMNGRKIAVVGGMNELGDFEAEGHQKVAEMLAKTADLIVLIGEKARKYYLPIFEKKSKTVAVFEEAREAGLYLREEIKEGDIILAKGSQNGIYAEEALTGILAEHLEPEKALVRQSEFWKNKKQNKG